MSDRDLSDAGTAYERAPSTYRAELTDVGRRTPMGAGKEAPGKEANGYREEGRAGALAE